MPSGHDKVETFMYNKGRFKTVMLHFITRINAVIRVILGHTLAPINTLQSTLDTGDTLSVYENVGGWSC